MKSITHYLEYLFLRAAESFITFIPRTLALRIGGFIGICLYHLGVYRSIVAKNMEFLALWPADEQKRITRRLYRTIGRYGADFLRSSRKLPPFTVHNEEIAREILARGKGIIALLAHFGNWEFLAVVFGRRIPDLNVIAKRMNNPYVDRWLARKRKKTGVETIYMSHALTRSVRALKRNGMLAVLIDQYARFEGNPVPFLGKKANTYRAVAGLVRMTGCAVMPTYAMLKEDGSYEIMMTEAPLDALPDAKTDEFILACQTQHNEIIGRWVRDHPDHWFGWFHKRFRDQIRY